MFEMPNMYKNNNDYVIFRFTIQYLEAECLFLHMYNTLNNTEALKIVFCALHTAGKGYRGFYLLNDITCSSTGRYT